MIDTYKTKGLRKRLVDELKGKGITDKNVLNAVNKVPRHFFLDNAFIEHAYQDKAFQIGEGQTISQPFTVAVQSQLIQINRGDKILEIGTGSGYQTCILLECGAKVYSIEKIRSLHLNAKKLLGQMGYSAHFSCGDGTKGWPSFAQYDKIIVTAGAPVLPESLIDQLKIGGLMVIPVGNKNEQIMKLIKKTEEGRYIQQEFGNFKFVPLKGEEGWQ